MLNPFRTNYDKAEDKITDVFIHVLQKCNLFAEFLKVVKWNTQTPPDLRESTRLQLQLHGDFDLSVKHAYILGVSTTGKAIDFEENQTEKKKGHPDAYIYDKQSETIVLFESKVGKNLLKKSQITRHKKVVLSIPEDYPWHEGYISWAEVMSFFDHIRSSLLGQNELYNYIIGNFVGVLSEDVLGIYDEEYYLHLAGHHRELITNIMALLRQLSRNYDYPPKLEDNKHDACQFNIQGTRVATFVLRHERFILHPGAGIGKKWADKMKDEYGIYYHQDGSYGGKELSIPFENIDPVTLELISTKEYVGAVPTIKDLIVQTFQVNNKLRKKRS